MSHEHRVLCFTHSHIWGDTHYSPPLTRPFSSSLRSCSGLAISVKAKGLFQFPRIAFSEVGCVSGWCAQSRCQFWAPTDSFLCFIYCTSVLRCRVVWSERLKKLLFCQCNAFSEHLRWILSILRTFRHSVYSPNLPLAFSFKWNRFAQLSRIISMTDRVPGFLITAVGQLIIVSQTLLGSDLSAEAGMRTSRNHFSPPSV